MPLTVELPNNESAVLKSPEDLTNRDVKNIRRVARQVAKVGQKLRQLGLEDAVEESDEQEEPDARKTLDILSQLSDEEDDDLDLFQRACLMMRLVSWTLDRPLPTNASEVDDLPRPIYSILTKAASELNLEEEWGVDGVDNPKVDTESSDN